MIHTKSVTKLLLFLTFAISIASCSTISYVPKVSLDSSPKTINKSVQVDKFKDSSPIEDRKNPFLGLSVTNEESMASGLDLEVTNAVVSDFSVNGLFKQISRRVENPDFVLKGEIKKFTGKAQLNNFAKISWVAGLAAIIAAPAANEPLIFLGAVPILSWYFGVPISKNTSEIEIEMSLYDKNNNLISTYTGKSGNLISTSMYYNKVFAVPSMTNKTFSMAIMQIREQILKDIDKLTK